MWYGILCWEVFVALSARIHAVDFLHLFEVPKYRTPTSPLIRLSDGSIYGESPAVDMRKRVLSAPAFRTDWPALRYWGDIPSDRHTRSGNLSFADGHVQPHQWLAPKEGRTDGTILAGDDRKDADWLLSRRPQSN